MPPYQLTAEDLDEIVALQDCSNDDFVGAVMEWLTAEPDESGDAVFRSPQLADRTRQAIQTVWDTWRTHRRVEPVAGVGPDAVRQYTVADLIALAGQEAEYDDAVFYWLVDRTKEADEVFCDPRVLEETFRSLDRIYTARDAQLKSPPPRYRRDRAWQSRTERTRELARRARAELRRDVGMLRERQRQQEAAAGPRAQAMRVLADAHPKAFMAARRAITDGRPAGEVKQLLREQFPEA